MIGLFLFNTGKRIPDGSNRDLVEFCTANALAVANTFHDLPPEELKDVPTVCGSLRQALETLDENRDFLKKGDVFTDDIIDGYIELKWDEVHAFEQTTHPIEFAMYYSV